MTFSHLNCICETGSFRYPISVDDCIFWKNRSAERPFSSPQLNVFAIAFFILSFFVPIVCFPFIICVFLSVLYAAVASEGDTLFFSFPFLPFLFIFTFF